MVNFTIISQGYLVRPIRDSLAAHGCQVHLQPEMDQWDFRNTDYILLHGPAYPIGSMVRRIKKTADAPPIIVWYSEPVPDPSTPVWLARTMSRMRYFAEAWYDERLAGWISSVSRKKLHAPGFVRWRRIGELLALQATSRLKMVCTFSQSQADFLRSLGLPAAVVPFGYHPDFGRYLDLPRDIDVLFLGTIGDTRRKRIFPALMLAFAEKNVHLRIIDGSHSSGFYVGEDRTLLLNHTKILLNVVKQPWDNHIFRLLLASANGALLLSEPVWEKSRWKFIPGIHFVSSELGQMAETARFYLDNEPARLEIINRTQSDIVQEMSMAKMAGLLLDQLKDLDKPGRMN